MNPLEYLKSFEFKECGHSSFKAHVAFQNASGKSIKKVAKEFGIPPFHVVRFYRRICRHIYREITWHIRYDEKLTESEREALISTVNEVLHDNLFRSPIGANLIEKYYLFIKNQEKNNPEKFENWLDEAEKIEPSQDEINLKKVHEVLARLETRYYNLIKNAEDEYVYITQLVRQIIEPKKKVNEKEEYVEYKPTYDLLASQDLAADAQFRIDKLLSRPLDMDEFNLSVRTLNCLKYEDIYYMGDLVTKTERFLLQTPNFGKISLREVTEFLKKHSLSLNMEIPQWERPAF